MPTTIKPTHYNFLDHGDRVTGAPRMEVRLSGKLPPKVDKAAKKLVETEAAMVAAFELVQAADRAFEEAQARSVVEFAALAKGDPAAVLASVSDEAPEEDPALAEARKAKAKAVRAHAALVSAVRPAYNETIETILGERDAWEAKAHVEAEQALLEVSGLIRTLETAVERLNAATGVHSMYVALDGDEKAGRPPQAVTGGQARYAAPHTLDFKSALAYFRQGTANADAFIRES